MAALDDNSKSGGEWEFLEVPPLIKHSSKPEQSELNVKSNKKVSFQLERCFLFLKYAFFLA